MSHLQAYIDKQNSWRSLFPKVKVDVLSMPTTSAEAKEIIEHLECDLSPENLCCDGELSGRALREKATMLNGAFKEAQTMMYDFEYGRIIK